MLTCKEAACERRGDEGGHPSACCGQVRADEIGWTIAVDTNVLLRFLIGDDPVQTPRAMRLIDEASARGEPVFISQIVLCEIEWVLDTTYGASRGEIHDIVKRLLASDDFKVEESPRVASCLEQYREWRGDFSDYLLGNASQVAGATTTYTFDRKLRRDPGFTFL